MAAFSSLSTEALRAKLAELEKEYASFVAKNLSLNMARGKPSSAQLDLSRPMLDVVDSDSSLVSENGTDCRNYGVGYGLDEAKRFMARMLDDEAENTIVCGNSSLNIMYDTIARCWMFGTAGSAPWCSLPSVKWICPVPGYDRHFGVTEEFGIEMIPVRMDDNGPDMDEVERIASSDSSVKGIWCVPKYSNPSGITYSDETVRRLASMPTAAEDFRIFWDNAYCVHHLWGDTAKQDVVSDIAEACRKAGNPDRYFKFASTSKITFPGAGIAAIASSPKNIDDIKKRMSVQTIGHDKINQIRHTRFLPDAEALAKHMSAHASILKPKFDAVCRILSEQLEGTVDCRWNEPRGGYFVSFDGPKGTAKRAVELAKNAGVVMTGAGSTWPHKSDPDDSNIRIAPSLPPVEELEEAMTVFTCCVKIAAIEALLD